MTRPFAWIALTTVLLTLGACSDKKTAAAASDTDERKPAAEGEAPTAAAISSDKARKAGIELRVAGPGDIRETLPLYGSIKPNAEREQEVRARYPGVVRTMAKRPGDTVAAGELLLSIESNDSLEPYAIRAPLAGTVLERRVNPGESVDGSSTLMVIADLATVWAEFAVFTRDRPRLRAGQAVRLDGADASSQGDARIAYIAPAGDRDSQSVVARAVVDNRSGRWIIGQFVTGEVVVAAMRAAVTVDPVALQTLDGKSVVFVETPKGFEAREVDVGHRSGDIVEITKGLVAGERYAAANSYYIKSDLLKGSGDED